VFLEVFPMKSILCAAAMAMALLSASTATAQPVPPFSPVARASSIISVSGVVAPPATRPAGFDAQADAVIAELTARLDAAGSSRAQVVSTTVYLAQASDFPALNASWARAFPAAPPTRTTVVTTPVEPGVLLQVSALAVTNGAERVIVQPAGWPVPPSPYSYAIRSGDTLFLSGLIARRGTDNTQIHGDITVQTHAVLDSARAILAAAGMTLEDVVSSRVYLTDPSLFAAMNDAYRPYFATRPPARATVRTGLTGTGYLVEITLTAVRGVTARAVTTPAADGSAGAVNPNFNSAIQAGGSLYLSGMLGITAGSTAAVAAQTAETLARLERTMTAAGFTWSNVYDSTIYVTDAAAADAVRDALRVKTGAPGPAGTVVVAGLMAPDAAVEIMLAARTQEQ
jgi:enamine deaminase RidA (YjgF/YER057c/UK114 family)